MAETAVRLARIALQSILGDIDMSLLSREITRVYEITIERADNMNGDLLLCVNGVKTKTIEVVDVRGGGSIYKLRSTGELYDNLQLIMDEFCGGKL